MARHLPPLRRWAKGRLPNWARDVTDTDDLVQDALLRTLRSIEDFEARWPGALLAYLRQAVLNRIRDEVRRRVRRPEETGLDGLEVNPGVSPLEAAIGRDALVRYDRAFNALGPEQQEAVFMRVEMGFM